MPYSAPDFPAFAQVRWWWCLYQEEQGSGTVHIYLYLYMHIKVKVK